MKNGIELIAEERQRQIEVEGWTSEHDSQHRHGALSKAAAVYALYGTDAETVDPSNEGCDAWPWDAKWLKPTTRIRNLTKAGALIAAEIDRIQQQGGEKDGETKTSRRSTDRNYCEGCGTSPCHKYDD
jgi:hypothetical protein